MAMRSGLNYQPFLELDTWALQSLQFLSKLVLKSSCDKVSVSEDAAERRIDDDGANVISGLLVQSTLRIQGLAGGQRSWGGGCLLCLHVCLCTCTPGAQERQKRELPMGLNHVHSGN